MAASKDTTGNSGHDEASPLGEAMSDAIDGMAPSIGDPAERPEMAEEFARNSYKDLMAEGWWPAIYAAGGSLATLIGAVLVARRRSRHSGLMAAAMPMMAAAKPIIGDYGVAARSSQLAARCALCGCYMQ